LEGPQRKLLAQLDIKPSAYSHGESVPRVRAAASRSEAARGATFATGREAVATEVQLEKGPEGAAASKGEPWSEQVGKLISRNCVA